MNLTLFKLINNLAHKSTLLDETMIILSKYVYIIFGIVLVCYYIYGLIYKNKKIRYMAVSTLILVLFNFLISYVIGFIYYVPRPFVNNKVNLLYPHKINASFPSDHSVGVMTIALGINNKVSKFGKVLIILSILVGISRIFVGHHYPLDVIVGFLIAFINNYLYVRFLDKKITKLYFK